MIAPGLPSQPSRRTLPIRLVTICGSGDRKTDAMRGTQDILEELFAARGITVVPVDLGDWSLKAVPRILAEIRSAEPDVILMQYPTAAFGASFGPAAVAVVQRIAPLVVMLHEFVAAHPLRKLAIGGLTARADLIATTADRETQKLQSWYPWLKRRTRHIPIASIIPSRPWAPTSPQKVVYFGQIRPEKGLEEFLECHRRVAPVVPAVEFQIIGAVVPKFAGFARPIIASARQSGITVVEGPETDIVAEALAQSTVALLPFPDGASFRRSSLLAAAGCGVPVVTNVGNDTPAQMLPFLEAASGVNALTNLTIRYLSNQPSRDAAHERSLRLSATFGWEACVDSYVDVFAEAAALQRPIRAGSNRQLAPRGAAE